MVHKALHGLESSYIGDMLVTMSTVALVTVCGLQSEAILQFRALNCNSESVRSLLPLQPRETSLPNGIQTLDRISLHSRTVLRPTSTRFPKATDN